MHVTYATITLGVTATAAMVVAATAAATAEDVAVLGAALCQACGVEEQRSAVGERNFEDNGGHDRR